MGSICRLFPRRPDNQLGAIEVSSIRSLLKPIIPVFSRLEAALLRYVIEHAPAADVRKALAKRVGSINSVSHYSEWKETNLHRTFLGKVFFVEAGTVETPMEEWALCKLSFRVPQNPKPIQATFWLVNNQLFSIGYSASIKKFRNAVPEVTQIEYNLPNSIDASGGGSIPTKSELAGFLGPWAANIDITEVKPVESSGIMAERLRQLDIALPADYVSLIEICGGFSTAEAQVFGAAELRLVPDSKGLLCALAELAEAHFLVVTESGAIQLISHESTILKSFKTFLDALQETLTSSDWLA